MSVADPAFDPSVAAAQGAGPHADQRTDHARVPVRRDRLVGLAVLVAGLAWDVAGSQLHHHFAPKQASGWRELPVYAISGVLGWIVAYGIAYIGPHRAVPTARTSRRVALGLAPFSVIATALLWYTPIPFCLAAASAQLIVRARADGSVSRWDRPCWAIAAACVVVTIAIEVVRIVHAAG
ncbi:hypothetical protein [uncultured Jatrophihabitans sp.]|uniref:hypothetical protein n=1 Tax=uncultured Jatrophihabitans sp. TaxID=1610747 RepID=UPI0035CBED4F